MRHGEQKIARVVEVLAVLRTARFDLPLSYDARDLELQIGDVVRVSLGRREVLPPLEVVDVDGDPDLQRRYGLNVPVLLLDGTVVCRQRLDAPELLRILRPR